MIEGNFESADKHILRMTVFTFLLVSLPYFGFDEMKLLFHLSLSHDQLLRVIAKKIAIYIWIPKDLFSHCEQNLFLNPRSVSRHLSWVCPTERAVSEQSWAGGLVGARNFHARGCSDVPFITSGFGKWLIFRLGLSGYDSQSCVVRAQWAGYADMNHQLLCWPGETTCCHRRPTSWALSLIINTAGSAFGFATNFSVRLIIGFW